MILPQENPSRVFSNFIFLIKNSPLMRQFVRDWWDSRKTVCNLHADQVLLSLSFSLFLPHSISLIFSLSFSHQQ